MRKGFFRNKRILITGGTGSIGVKVLDTLTKFSPKEIKVFSRNEYKQYQLRYHYSKSKNIRYVLGDVRDRSSVEDVMKNVDIVFHCAALKHVPFSEEMVEEFVKTNILGSINIMKSSLNNNVQKVVSISTDKVVDPANLMGLTKAIQEKVFSSIALQKGRRRTSFVNVRFGNVTGTHGSLFPIIYHQITTGRPITVTHPEMTRFFISSSEAIDLIFWGAINGNDGEIIIKKMKSTPIVNVAQQFLSILKVDKKNPIKYIGIRAGEKMHESLITEDNLFRTKEKSGYYIIAPYKSGESVVLSSRKPKFVREQFLSQNPKNFLGDRELRDYIKEYLLEHKLRNYII